MTNASEQNKTGTLQFTQPDGTTGETTIEKLVGVYVTLRDKVKELDKEHKDRLSPIKQYMGSIEAALQKFMDGSGSKSIRTAAGTCISSTRYSATLADPEAFMNYVIEEGKFELLDRRANTTAVRDYVDEFKILPPGCNLSSTAVVNVRRAGDKEDKDGN